MNFIAVYCDKEDTEVLINLDLVQAMDADRDDGEMWLNFIVSGGMMRVKFNCEKRFAEYRQKIADMVLKGGK